MRFDHERIPERLVHARGAGAHGYFRLKPEYYSFAPVLNETFRTTPVFIRFSTVQGVSNHGLQCVALTRNVQGSRGSADTVRDVRGVAVNLMKVIGT